MQVQMQMHAEMRGSGRSVFFGNAANGLSISRIVQLRRQQPFLKRSHRMIMQLGSDQSYGPDIPIAALECRAVADAPRGSCRNLLYVGDKSKHCADSIPSTYESTGPSKSGPVYSQADRLSINELSLYGSSIDLPGLHRGILGEAGSSLSISCSDGG